MINMTSELSDSLEDWQTLRQSERLSELHPTLNVITEFKDREKLELLLMGDEHIGSKFHDSDLLKENLEYAHEKGAPIILLGDELETATRNSVGAGVYEQEEILQDQIQHFLHLYKPLARSGLLLGMHPGNHELRVYKDCGANITKLLAQQLGVKYLGWGKLHIIRVGSESYTLYTTHGASGARMPHTKIKGALDLANLADAEIYAMGHLHQLSHHVRTFYSVDKKNKKVVESQKHFLICGSYLSHWGSYGHMKSYEPTRKGSPKLKLSGTEHRIRVSL